MATAAPGSSSCAVLSATPQQIYDCLNLPAAPADYVVLIDTSGSMQGSGRYAQVLDTLPGLLRDLAATPGSRVALDTFDAGVFTAKQLGPVGDPNADVAALPPSAVGQHTDFGTALNLAYQQLADASASFGAVILLSDGRLDASPGSPYAAYGDQGWLQLRAKYSALDARMPVNGYGIELTPDTDLGTVLGQVFPSPVAVSAATGSLAGALTRARDDAERDQAAAVIQHGDSGAAVTARFAAAGGTGSGLGRLDLAAGHASIRLILTATAAHIPLTVSDLEIAVSGFPLRARPETTAVTLEPGASRASADIPVQLTWTPPSVAGLLPGNVPENAGLTVTGRVASPWAQTIRGEIGDASFTVGQLSGGAATVGGTAHETVLWWLWLLWILAALAASAVVALLVRHWLRHPRLRGSLTVVGADNRLLGHVELSGRAVRIDAARLKGMPATATVHGVRSRLHWDGIEITCTRPESGVDPEIRRLRSGDERVLRGLRFIYWETTEERTPPTASNSRIGPPKARR